MALGKFNLWVFLILGSTLLVLGAAAPATQSDGAKPARSHRLVQPWSLLKSLTPEQTQQIEKIHADAAEQIKKIEAKETDDINALLTPDQLSELKAAEAKHKEELSARRGKTAATQPM